MSVSIPDSAPIPDTYTPISVFGAAAINALAPFVTLHMAWYLDAIGVFVDPVYTLVMGQGIDDGVTPTVGTYVDGVLVTEGYEPGYGSALNPQTATVDQLAYLAQWVGVKIPAGADYATSLSLVTAESGLNRGTPAAVIAAAKRNLIGTQSVALVERTYVDGTPNAGWAGLLMRPEEAQPTNGVVNPSFEYDTVGGAPAAWTAHGTNTLTVMNAAGASAPAFSGSLMMECLYSNDLRLASINTANYVAGETRTISAYVWIPAGWNGGQITLTNDNGGTRGDFTLDGGAGSGPIDANMALTNQWQRLATAIVAGGSGFTGGVFIRAASPPTSGPEYILVDAVDESEAAILLPYGDGDTPNWSWAGTRGDSTSQKSLQPLIDDVTAVKFGGIMMWYALHDWTIGQLEGAYATVALAEAAFSTVVDLETDVT